MWGQRATSREIAKWRDQAREIPDPQLRRDALRSIDEKRDHADGAALFWVLPRKRNQGLLRLLVAYQTIWDFLDTTSEHVRAAHEANGYQLHLALVEALTPGAPISDYYKLHPWTEDAGYLRSLVEACQRGCLALPSYSRVRALVLAGVARCNVQAINHDHDASRRELSLRRWAVEALPTDTTLTWFETTAAASAFVPHVLLALAADPYCSEYHIACVHDAYFPWLSLAIAMLDSYVDQAADLAQGNHSYVAYYVNDEVAVARLTEIVRRATSRMRNLRDAERHAVIASCMVAMYLSKRDARDKTRRSSTRRIVRECDGLTKIVLPVIRIWRLCRERSSR